MFDNACNVLVTGGSFISQKRGMNGIQYLVQAIATSAIHDSDERYDPPKCHPETRKTILEDIMAWIRNPSRSKRVLRLHGPAGAGKSAISQTIADLCQEFGLLAASFFFSRTSRERNTGSRLFSTLAYQLAIKVPQLKELIEEVIESDPAIVSKSMELQLKHLILEPLGQLRQASPQPLPQVIIIDGLDECIGFGECTPDKHQMDILQFILQALEDVKFPFCFIIASRPEFHILSQFDSPAYSQVTWRISLDNRKDVKEDIRVVLRSGFARIHDNPVHVESMKSIPKPWPSDYIINKLVGRSSGQFVYASTVLKFVDDLDYEPCEQLRIVMDISKRDPAALSELDKLYSGILLRCRNSERTLDVLGHLIALIQAADAYATTWGSSLSTMNLLTVIDQLLSLNPGDSFRSLRNLHSLISITSPSDNGQSSAIRFHHTSFSDFLRKEKRSRRFFIKVSAVHTRISRSCIRVMTQFSSACVRSDEYLVWVYAVIFWCYHCSKSQYDEDLLNDLHQFNVCDDWILVQSLSSPRVNEERLREALDTFDIQELVGCPGQSRWVSGNPDIQCMSKELGTVITWLKKGEDITDIVTAIVEQYSKAFDASFAQHLAQIPDSESTRVLLGILLSGEVSSKILLDFQAIIEKGLDSFLGPLKLFLYGYSISGSNAVSPPPSTWPQDPMLFADSSSDYRLGIKSELFCRFLEKPRPLGKYINSNVHSSIALTLLGAAPHAISKQWNAADYAQAWTYSLVRSRKHHNDLIDRLLHATALYLSSPHLQRGLRRHHAKRVLAWLKKGPPTKLSDLITKWSSLPLWKVTWHLDEGRSPEPFPYPVLYELALVHPVDSIKDGF